MGLEFNPRDNGFLTTEDRVSRLEEAQASDDGRFGLVMSELSGLRTDVTNSSALLNETWSQGKSTMLAVDRQGKILEAMAKGMGVSMPPPDADPRASSAEIELKVGTKVRSRADWARLVAAATTALLGIASAAYAIGQALGGK